MKILRWAVGIGLALAAHAGTLWAQESPPPPDWDGGGIRPESPAPQEWLLRFEPMMRLVRGTTQVREYEKEGTFLDFGDDLNSGATGGLRMELRRRTALWDLGMEAETFGWTSSATFDHEVHYDGDTFAPDTDIDVQGFILFARFPVRYSPRALQSATATLRLVGGVEWPYASVTLDNGESRGSEGYKQFIPYPYGGLELEVRLGRDATWTTSVTGTTLSGWSTFQYEGGLLRQDITKIDVRTQIEIRMSASASLVLGVEYLYWDARLRSPYEDDNRLKIASPAAMVGVDFRF